MHPLLNALGNRVFVVRLLRPHRQYTSIIDSNDVTCPKNRFSPQFSGYFEDPKAPLQNKQTSFFLGGSNRWFLGWWTKKYCLFQSNQNKRHQDDSVTLPKTDIAPAKKPSQKETSLRTSHLMCYVSFREGNHRQFWGLIFFTTFFIPPFVWRIQAPKQWWLQGHVLPQMPRKDQVAGLHAKRIIYL